MTEKVIPAGLQELSRFGVGEESNALYFDGNRVETTTMVVLTDNQKLGGFVLAASAFVGAIAACFSAYAAMTSEPMADRAETSVVGTSSGETGASPGEPNNNE